MRVNEHAFEYFGGVTRTVVPDRLKAAIVDQDPYDPTVQRAFADFARHYGTAVVPARSYKPRDKAKVEGAELIAQRWILARMRHETFFSLAALNKRIAELVDELNERPMKTYGGVSRRQLFEEVERDALGPLPDRRFEPSTWKGLKVNRDYHVAYDDHFYSVPHRLVGEKVEARVTLNTVELFFVGKRVASHARSTEKYKHTTVVAHMPKNHREWAERDPAQLVDWGREVGPYAETMVRRILDRSPIPMQGWRSARGLKRLADKYPPERIEEACRRALRFGAQSYRPVADMLKTGLDLRPLPDEVASAEEATVIDHDQVRGPDYYNQ